MATINIANLTFTHKGDYDGSTAYVKNDVVYYSTNGNAYIAKQNTTGNAPTNGTYWSQFAAGSGGIWNAGLSLGSASQSLRVNSGGSALEFYTPSAGGVLQVKETLYDTLNDFNNSTYNYINSNFKVDITPTAADSKFLLEANLSIGMSNHDCSCGFGFLDSQVGVGDSNIIPPRNNESSGVGSRIQVSIGSHPGFAANSDPDNYWMISINFSTLYTPSSQNTNARSFYPSSKRGSYNGAMHLNYGQIDSTLNLAGVSMIRVSEIANGIT